MTVFWLLIVQCCSHITKVSNYTAAKRITVNNIQSETKAASLPPPPCLPNDTSYEHRICRRFSLEYVIVILLLLLLLSSSSTSTLFITVCVYTCIHTCMPACIHIHTCMHAYIHSVCMRERANLYLLFSLSCYVYNFKRMFLPDCGDT